MPGLRLHPRTMQVSAAETDLQMTLVQFQRERDLTDTELLRILLMCATSVSKYVLRAERHPGDPERKADEACDALDADGGCACVPDEDEEEDDDDGN